MKTIKDMDIDSKKVIIRCDFNVPIKDGKIIDDTRIKASLKTINYCLEHNAKIILLSHLGRVKEEADLQKNDLAPVATRLSELLNKEVLFIPKTRGVEVEDAISKMQPTDIVLLQNTRYEDLDGKKESSNDPELGKYWASLGDVFINDEKFIDFNASTWFPPNRVVYIFFKLFTSKSAISGSSPSFLLSYFFCCCKHRFYRSNFISFPQGLYPV